MRLVRVTQIESFRKWITGDEESYMTEGKVIDSLTGAFQGNDKTRIGTAFHWCVENDMTPSLTLARSMMADAMIIKPEGDAYQVTLSPDHVQIATDYRNEMKGASHEIRLYHEMEGFRVTGCADVVWGNCIHDIKTKYGSVRAGGDADYRDSFQWKCYCEMFGCDVFTFDFFRFEDYKDTMLMDVHTIGLEREIPLTCYRYNTMEEDNHLLVREFGKWVKARDLEQYLPDKDFL